MIDPHNSDSATPELPGLDPLNIGPEGAQQAREVAERNDRAMLRVRIAALVLVVAAGVVLVRQDAAIHALWLIPAIPLFFNADFKFGGMAIAYRAVATKHESGVWEMTPVNEILRSSYRHEYYGLLTLALLAVAIRS